MLEILYDCNTFKIVEFDETILQEDRLIRKLKQLKNDGFITEREYNYCRPRGSQPARIYGLPKIHKTRAPLRPIVSASGTFNYKLAKLLAMKLDYLRKNNTIIKDTFTFVDELHSLKFDNSQIKMISFDITSLFTNVPLNRTIQIILDKLYGLEHTCTYSNMKREDWCSKCKNRFEMKYLLESSTKETNFIFNNKIYSQTNGVVMGSPLGPLFADIYVNYIEDKLMSRLKKNGLLYWRRFVDDTFAIIKKDANVEKIIDILNSFDNSIIFTFEEESNNSLPFLDIKITKLPNRILTDDTTITSRVSSTDNSNIEPTNSLNDKISMISDKHSNNELNNNLSNNELSKNLTMNVNNKPLNISSNKYTTISTNTFDINNKPHIILNNKFSTISTNTSNNNNKPLNILNKHSNVELCIDLTNNHNNKPHNISSNNISTISTNISDINNKPHNISSNKCSTNSTNISNNDNNKPHNISNMHLNNDLANIVNNKPHNILSNKFSINSTNISNNITSLNINNNPKINSFTNSIINSKAKLSTNSNNILNNSSLINQTNILDNKIDIVSTSNSNSKSKSTNKTNKKLFANLTYNSDKKLFVTSDKNLSISLINNLDYSSESHTCNNPANISNDISTTNIVGGDTNNVNNVITTSINTPHNSSNFIADNFTNSFSTDIYRKPTYTGLITKWKSFVPHSYKISTISSMVYRAIRICSSYKLMHEEFEFIEFIGKLNGYPSGFIKTQIRKTLDRYFNKINGTQTLKLKDNRTIHNDISLKKEHIFFDIPFFGKPTEIFKKQIIKMAKTIDPQINCQPIQRPPASLSNYFPIKDPIPKLLKSKVVYQLNCSNCDATYVGKTIRHVSKRLQEHGADFIKSNETITNSTDSIDNSIILRRSERNKDKVINYFPKELIDSAPLEQNNLTHSAVKQHENDNNHRIDWINFNIIARDNKHYQLLVKESLLINNLEPTLNRTTTSVPLIIFPEGFKTKKPKVKMKSTLDTLPLCV